MENKIINHEDTLPSLFQRICLKYMDKTCLIFDDESISYREFYETVSNISKNLLNLGISKGDRVAIILPNCKEYIVTYFALFNIGACAVPINTRVEESQVENLLEAAFIHTIIFTEKIGMLDFEKIINNTRARLTNLKHLILLDGPEGKTTEGGYINFNSLMKQTDCTIEIEPLEEDHTAMLCFTSGTTGNPKGILIPQSHIVKTSLNTAEHWNFEDQVALSIAPLYASQGFLPVIMDFFIGATMIFLSSFNPNQIIHYISRGNATIVHTQPTMWTLLLSSTAIKFANFKSLKKVIVSGSVCSPTLARKIEEMTGCTLLNVYGLIEATGVVTITRLEDSREIRLNTVGRPISGVEIKIVNKNREEVPRGEVGELAVRGHIVKGYINDAEKTTEAIDNEGWLYTGDLARYYDNENIRIMGKCDEMIIRGGIKIYPVDIEEVILTNQKVFDVAVVGRNHGLLGEQTIAFIVPKPVDKIDKNEIRNMCIGRLDDYMIPDDVIFISQMPTILAGKVQKNTLKEWANKGVPTEYQMLFN